VQTGGREQVRDHRDRRIVGVAIALSVLVHIGIVVLFYSGLLGFRAPAQPQTVDFDLANIDAETLAEIARNLPVNTNLDRLPPSGLDSKKNAAVDFADHNSVRLPPMPAIGEGVGERATGAAGAPNANSGASDGLNRKVDEMLARAGMPAPLGGAGGEDGVNRYSPNVAEPGEAISISVREIRYLGYFAHMRDKICLAWVYPRESVRGREQGVVNVRFTIQRNGEVSEATVSQSSGRRALDDCALNAVREAGFNPIRAEWPDKELQIYAAFRYELSGFGFGDVPGLPRAQDLGMRGRQYLSLAVKGGRAQERLCE
jgi:TonB family protein